LLIFYFANAEDADEMKAVFVVLKASE